VKLRERVDQLSNAASNLNFSDINGLSTLSADVGTLSTKVGNLKFSDINGLSTLSTNFGTLQRELDAVKFQHTLIVGEQCEVTLACPLAGNYATALNHNALSNRVGMSATGSQAATGLFSTVQDIKNSVDETNDRLGVGGVGATGLFKTVKDNRDAADETNVRLGMGGVGATGLFKTVKDNRDAADETNDRLGKGGDNATGLFQLVGGLIASVGKAKAGSTAASGLFLTVDEIATSVYDNSEALGGLTASVGKAKAGSTAASGLFGQVEALEAEVWGGVKPVDITDIIPGETQAGSMQVSACYPQTAYTSKLRDSIKKDCESRGSGWTHDTGTSESLLTCYSTGGRTYKAGVCYKHHSQV